MVSFFERMEEVRRQLAQKRADPWRDMLKPILRNFETIGTRPVFDLLGVPSTTGNARRLARIMRDLGYVPIKSRRLLPGGHCDTTVRGWTLACRPRRSEGEKAPAPSQRDWV